VPEARTAAVFPSVARARGHYESFYLRASHPTDPLGVWIRHTIHKPPGGPPSGSVWFTLFEAGGPREHLHRAVVVSRPEPARDDAEVCLEPFPQRRLQLRGAVADDRDARRLDPQAQQLRGQERPVSIRALAPDELAARHDDDPARARSLGEEALRRSQLFSRAAMVQRMAELYGQVSSRASARRAQ